MTATIKIYKTNITPDRNALVESLGDYLATCAVGYSNNDLQFQKITLDMFIDLNITQGSIGKNDIGNYVDIYQNFKHYYYFVMGDPEWLSQSSLRLQLSLDTINTFNGDYTFSDKTNVIRQHKDQYKIDAVSRFSPNTTINLHARVDEVPEGLEGAAIQREGNTAINQAGYANQKWYLVYQTEAGSTDKPVEVYLYPKNTNTPYLYSDGAAVTWTYNDMDLNKSYIIYKNQNTDLDLYIGNNHYSWGSNVKAIGLERDYYHSPSETHEWLKLYEYGVDYQKPQLPKYQVDGLLDYDIVFAVCHDAYEIDRSLSEDVDLATIGESYNIININASVAGTRYLKSVDTIDRSRSELVQIVELPYLPDDSFTWSGQTLSYDTTTWTISGAGVIKLKNYTAEFENKLRTTDINPLVHRFVTTTEENFKKMGRDYKENTLGIRDTKFLHSELYTYKLVYDTENIPIKMEKIDYDYNYYNEMPKIDITFKPSNTLSNQFGFKYDLHNGSYLHEEDHDNFMISSKDTKLTLYNNAWLDYVRNGKTQDNWTNTISTITSAGSAAAGTIAGVATLATKIDKAGSFAAIGTISKASSVASIAVTVLNSAANIANTWVNNKQKRDQLKAQATTINGNSSVDLFDWYGGNKLYIYTYRPNDEAVDKISDVFFYCGYSVDKKQLPDLTSRYWFNFVQCEPVFDIYNEVYQDYQEDLKARWSNGVTVYHCHNNEWDWNQEYANWQNNLF